MNPILAHSLPLAFRNQSTTKTMNGWYRDVEGDALSIIDHQDEDDSTWSLDNWIFLILLDR